MQSDVCSKGVKINDGNTSKEGDKEQGRSMSRKRKKEGVKTHVEIIKDQQVGVKRALAKVVKNIPKDENGIELKVTLKIRLDFEIHQKDRLINSSLKHEQVMNNVEDFNMTNTKVVNSSIKKL